MKYTEEQIEKMLELKESIIDKMEKHQEELDFLQKNLDVLDAVSYTHLTLPTILLV